MTKKIFSVQLLILGILFAPIGYVAAEQGDQLTLSQDSGQEDAFTAGSSQNKSGDAQLNIESAVHTAQELVRDPFEQKFNTEGPAMEALPQQNMPETALALQGLGLGDKTAYAVINGDVYYAGEEKNGIKLLEVRKGEADVVVNGATKKLQLLSEDELKKALGRRLRKNGESSTKKNQTDASS